MDRSNPVASGDRLLHYVLADVFAEEAYAGNQLAVFLDADGLSTQQMQRLARELNLAESAFVTSPVGEIEKFRIRIFTPLHEMPFAGHPTVGTACVLATRVLGLDANSEARFVLQENVGSLEVRVRRNGDRLYGEFETAMPPEFGPPAPESEALARLLSIERGAIDTVRYAPESVSCGVPYLIVKVASRQVLAGIRVDPAEWEATIDPYWARQIYVFTDDAELPTSSFRARMFTKWLGIVEDSATGSAAAALAAYLARREVQASGMTSWRIEQGYEIGRPSLIWIEVQVEDREPTSVRVGGGTVIVGGGSLRAPPTA